MLDLSEVELDEAKSKKYKEMAYRILSSLSRSYLSGGSSYAGILLHSCFHKPNNIATDNSLIFGDYYIEALTKLIAGGVTV